MPSYRKTKKENQRNVEKFGRWDGDKGFETAIYILFFIGLICFIIILYIAYQNYKFISTCDTLPSKGIHYLGGIFFWWLYFLARKFGIIKCLPKI